MVLDALKRGSCFCGAAIIIYEAYIHVEKELLCTVEGHVQLTFLPPAACDCRL